MVISISDVYITIRTFFVPNFIEIIDSNTQSHNTLDLNGSVGYNYDDEGGEQFFKFYHGIFLLANY